MTEATSVEIAGPVRRIVFPDLCACCGRLPARKRIKIEKAFEHWTHYAESYSWWEYTSVRVPFCSICAEQHGMRDQRLSPPARLLLIFQTWTAIPMLGGAAFALYFFLQSVEHPQSWIFTTVFAAVFTLIGLGSALAGWRATHHRAIPRPTSISASFSFSEDLSKMLEPQRRIFHLQNSAFAAAFVGANRSRIWNPAGPHAHIARSLRWVVLTMLGLTTILVAFWELLHRL